MLKETSENIKLLIEKNFGFDINMASTLPSRVSACICSFFPKYRRNQTKTVMV